MMSQRLRRYGPSKASQRSGIHRGISVVAMNSGLAGPDGAPRPSSGHKV
jgi:hypothetical protein